MKDRFTHRRQPYRGNGQGDGRVNPQTAGKELRRRKVGQCRAEMARFTAAYRYAREIEASRYDRDYGPYISAEERNMLLHKQGLLSQEYPYIPAEERVMLLHKQGLLSQEYPYISAEERDMLRHKQEQTKQEYPYISAEERNMQQYHFIKQGIDSLRSMEELRPENWQHLTIPQRLATLRTVENRLAACARRPVARVVADKQMEPSANGEYWVGAGTIRLNSDLLTGSHDVAKVVDAIAHEGRHAYQYHCVAHPDFHPDAAQVLLWAENLSPGHYKTLQEYGMALNHHQPVEADAYAFGKAIRDGLYGGQQQ